MKSSDHLIQPLRGREKKTHPRCGRRTFVVVKSSRRQGCDEGNRGCSLQQTDTVEVCSGNGEIVSSSPGGRAQTQFKNLTEVTDQRDDK